MKKKLKSFKLCVIYYIGCALEGLMALLFPLENFIRGKKKSHKMSTGQFKRFKKYVNARRGKTKYERGRGRYKHSR